MQLWYMLISKHCIMIVQWNSDFCVIKSNEREERCNQLLWNNRNRILLPLFIGVYRMVHLCVLYLPWIRKTFLYCWHLSFIFKSYPFLTAFYHGVAGWLITGMKENIPILKIFLLLSLLSQKNFTDPKKFKF